MPLLLSYVLEARPNRSHRQKFADVSNQTVGTAGAVSEASWPWPVRVPLASAPLLAGKIHTSVPQHGLGRQRFRSAAEGGVIGFGSSCAICSTSQLNHMPSPCLRGLNHNIAVVICSLVLPPRAQVPFPLWFSGQLRA